MQLCRTKKISGRETVAE